MLKLCSHCSLFGVCDGKFQRIPDIINMIIFRVMSNDIIDFYEGGITKQAYFVVDLYNSAKKYIQDYFNEQKEKVKNG